MINLLTTRKYKELHNGRIPPPVDLVFDVGMPREIGSDKLAEIVKGIENTEIFCGYPLAKFGLDFIFPWENVSTGCKTALLIEFLTESKTIQDVSLDECGDNALGICFKLLSNNPYVRGVLSQYDETMHSCEGTTVIVNGESPIVWELAYDLGVQ